MREADILLHIVDISHPGFEDQIEVVNETLKELDINNKPVILVFNKIDAFTYEKKDEDDLTPKLRENYSLEELESSWMALSNHPCIFISAKNKVNMDALKELLYDEVKKVHVIRYPYNDFLYTI